MALMLLVQELNGDGLPRLDVHLLVLEFREGWLARLLSGL